MVQKACESFEPYPCSPHKAGAYVSTWSIFPPFPNICHSKNVLFLKAVVEDRYEESKDKAKVLVSQASAASLTSDMWTSINTDAYLAVICYFVHASNSSQSVVLGVLHFPEAHTAEDLARMKAALLSEWGITHKVTLKVQQIGVLVPRSSVCITQFVWHIC